MVLSMATDRDEHWLDEQKQLDEQYVVERFLARPTDDSFSELFRIFVPRLIAYFRLRGCDRADASDMAQDVMIAVYRHSASLRDKNVFRTWLFKIARNVLLKSIRGKHPEQITDYAEEVTPGERRPAANRQFLSPGFEVTEWMECLVPQEKQVIMLRYLEELEYQEIADVLELPIGTVKSRLFTAHRKIQRLLGRPAV